MAVGLVPRQLFQGVISSSETLLGLMGSDENRALPWEPQSPVASRSLLSPLSTPCLAPWLGDVILHLPDTATTLTALFWGPTVVSPI